MSRGWAAAGRGFTRSVCPSRFPVKLPGCGRVAEALSGAAPAQSRGRKPRGLLDAFSAILVNVCASLWHLRSAQRLCRDGRWVRVREGKGFYIYAYILLPVWWKKRKSVSLSSGPWIHLLFFHLFEYFVCHFALLHHLWTFVPFLCLHSLTSPSLSQFSSFNSHFLLLCASLFFLTLLPEVIVGRIKLLRWGQSSDIVQTFLNYQQRELSLKKKQKKNPLDYRQYIIFQALQSAYSLN